MPRPLEREKPLKRVNVMLDCDALACAFNASACWEGHTLSVNGQVHSRTWRGGKGKRNIPEYPARIAS